jgi:hypothetical protein
VGLWATTPHAYAWLREYLTADHLRDLLPEAADLPIDRYELPNLLALNFVIHGLLAPGVSATTRPDAQAKGPGGQAFTAVHLGTCGPRRPGSHTYHLVHLFEY